MSNDVSTDSWFQDYAEGHDELQVEEYDITATPNDFNVMTLCSFMDSGSVRIPEFQRHFVWDMARASKLIESLILGLPVPQLFLYEQKRNEFLVIDGQQRLMSIYYFIKKRFPRKEKRADIRRAFDRNGAVPEHMLHDDQYFQTFNLRLPEPLPGHRNRFKGLNYSTLGEYKSQLDLRPDSQHRSQTELPVGRRLFNVRGLQSPQHRRRQSPSPGDSHEHVPLEVLRHAQSHQHRKA